jgi:hypothetical protein
MVDFDMRFEVLPGTKNKPTKPTPADAYKAVPGKVAAE